MTRIRSALRFALPVALLLGTAVATMAPTPAIAGDVFSHDWIIWDSDKDPGKDGKSYSIFYDNNDPKLFLVVVYGKDGSSTWATVRLGGDPNPDDATGKGSEPVDVGALIKKGLISYEIRVTVENSPLAKWIDRNGNGNVPHWNPGDSDGNGPGLAPKGNSDGPTPKQIADIERIVNEIASSLAGIRDSMGDGVDGLAGEDAPGPNKNNGNSGRGKGTGDGSGNNDNKVKYSPGGEATTLGPRPDLVNPAPKNKIGSTNLFTPGLLEGNGGFTGNGPSATGGVGGSAGLRGGPPR